MGIGSLYTGSIVGENNSRRYRGISTIFMEVGDRMLVLVTYDVSTQDKAGRVRLRKVAKECINYGQRVQNSVFECCLDASQALLLKDKLVHLIKEDEDSLRFYYLGNKYDTKIEHFGTKSTYEPEGVLII